LSYDHHLGADKEISASSNSAKQIYQPARVESRRASSEELQSRIDQLSSRVDLTREQLSELPRVGGRE